MKSPFVFVAFAEGETQGTRHSTKNKTMDLIAKKDFVHGDDVIKTGDPLTTNTADGGILINRGLCVLAETKEETKAEASSPAPAKKAAKKSATKK